MAEETADLIEESNDDMESWLYYSKETKSEENNDVMDNFSATEAELIYIESGELVNNDNEQQTFQYDGDDDNDLINNAESRQITTDSNEIIEEQTFLEQEDDLSKHNLILRETIDENGQLVEGYYCQQCNLAFNTIEDFLNYHPYIELLSENPEEQEEQQQDIISTISGDKLWDLVENLEETEDNADNIEEIIEMKPNCIQEENAVSNALEELDKERYFCYDCQQVFTDLTTAENHDCCSHQEHNSLDLIESNSTLLVENDDQNVYRCHLCDKDYTSLRSFNNHLRWHKKAEDILGHTKTLHDVAVVCEVCNTVFASEKNLKLHMKMHKKQTVKTIQEALPVGAQNEYNELNQFFCEICNKSFDQKLLVIHKNMHQNLEEYNCGKCNKQFENLPSYEIHMQMHVDNITNVKKTSTTTVKQINNFIVPEEVMPSTSAQGGSVEGGKRKHACQYCGKEFQRPYEKVKHERIHTGEKPYECEVCGKTFRVSYSLTLHLRTHTDIRPYVCATCNKRFKQQSVYVHHLKTHVVERGYKCDICGKSFRTSVQLSGHKNIHSKPYNCTECNRPFASLYSVKIHMKTHNKGHKSNKNLKNRCSICGASYARIFALRFHLKEQHGLDVHPTQLLAATSSANTNVHKDMDAETAILMNAANEASNQEMHFINADDDNDVGEDNEVDEDNEEENDVERGFSSQVDHEENIQNPALTHNSYLDETEAATQTILNTQEISVDNFPTEEIITDWLSK
ncbi:zinc finger and SCAN domain-containing protein 2 [Lucilia sericata]|uniref:zinc finger and SCAN domain-containing protein 2 n=1 Tax=Lucilia sericata TaxID=13632 RepID=UPI0018A7F5C9|nr:zinc finger and SCAN domain-containing protein 2 [Lucilia sericata]